MLEIVIISLVILVLSVQMYNKHKKNNYRNYKEFVSNNMVLLLITVVSVGCLVYVLYKTKMSNDLHNSILYDVQYVEPHLLHSFSNEAVSPHLVH
jgi:hypothetical protein